MDRLDWLDDERKQMVIKKHGNVFADSNHRIYPDPIRHYAVQTLKEILESKELRDKDNVKELHQLFKEMKDLDCFNQKDYSANHFELLLQFVKLVF